MTARTNDDKSSSSLRAEDRRAFVRSFVVFLWMNNNVHLASIILFYAFNSSFAAKTFAPKLSPARSLR